MKYNTSRDISFYNDGFKRIPITNKLKNYIERSVYVKNRYNKFMNLISEDWLKYMTKEEFDSSLKYYQERCSEAFITFDLVMKNLKDIYKDQIEDNSFDVDFVDNCIVVNTNNNFNLSSYINNLHKNNFEQYSDMLMRIFDNEDMSMEVGGEGKHVMSITMQVTDRCNMACTYCYQHNKGQHSMSFDVACKFIDMILDGGEKTNRYMNPDKLSGIILDFIGGEPFLEVELIDQICEYFLAQLFKRKHHWVLKFMFSFSSNGLLYFKENVQEYLKKYSGFVSLGISIDGNKSLHDACRVDLDGKGTYDRAILAAKDLMQKYGGETTKMTISKFNVKYTAEAVINMIELGYKMIHLNCVYEDQWDNKDAEILYYELKKIVDYLDENHLFDEVNVAMLNENTCKPLDEKENRNWCGGTGLMMAVDWKGDIYPCLRYMESSIGTKQPPYIIGNIYEGICLNEEYNNRLECMKCITRKSQSTDECFNCPIASGCGWCSAYNYECFGTVNKRATFICCMHKAQALALSYYIKKKNNQCVLNCPSEWAIPIIGMGEYNWLVDFCKK